ncbi:lipid II flippase family protein [Peribacillus cavernae]|nr:DUF2837 family protein [Peribacillus cavernae]
MLTTVIHKIDTLTYSVRLNSVKSGKFALSFRYSVSSITKR